MPCSVSTSIHRTMHVSALTTSPSPSLQSCEATIKGSDDVNTPQSNRERQQKMLFLPSFACAIGGIAIVCVLQGWTCHSQEARRQQQNIWVNDPPQYFNQILIIMKSLCTTIFKRISSNKFYEIVSKQKDRIIPKSAQEVIISKYLTNTQPKHEDVPSTQSKSKGSSGQIRYSEIIGDNPSGSIIEQDYKDTQLSLMSLNYRNVNLEDIYKVCEKASPDLILVQARPDAYLNHFQLLPKKTAVFSDTQYLQQLTLNNQAITQHVLTDTLASTLQSIVGKSTKEKEKVLIKDNKDLIDDDVVLMASYFAKSTSTPLMLGELPQQPWREWFCNSHTLMELQELFKHICKNIPFYRSLQFSPYRLGALLKPNLFLNIRDRYISTLIEMAIATKQYRRILCILGVGENQAVKDILLSGSLLRREGEVQAFTPIVEYLIAPEIKHSLFRNTQGWQIIQKHVLLDVLHYGQEIVNQPLSAFPTTNRVIEHYGRSLNEYPQSVLLKFRYDKTMGYLGVMREQVGEGQGLKRKFMMREAIRGSG